MFFFNFDNFKIAGSSPEILVRVRDNKITIRPIAGTRPRGRNFKEDNKFQKELLNDKKEISEHLMLLDLGRNDVGKVSKIGSVKVDQKFKIEKYSHVMHIVSNVVGDFDNKNSWLDTLLPFNLFYWLNVYILSLSILSNNLYKFGCNIYMLFFE